MIVAKLFEQEVKDKKRIASNVHSKTGKRGYVGKMMFPTDIMSRKEKYRHRKAGKVEVTNMYDTLITYEQFLKLSEEDKKRHLIAYRDRFTNSEILDAWRIGSNTLYKYVKKFNLPKAKRIERNHRTNRTKKNELNVPVEAFIVEEKQLAQVSQAKQEINEDGFHFKIKGLHTADKLIKRLEKLALILSDEESEFEINLTIQELAK